MVSLASSHQTAKIPANFHPKTPSHCIITMTYLKRLNGLMNSANLAEQFNSVQTKTIQKRGQFNNVRLLKDFFLVTIIFVMKL